MATPTLPPIASPPSSKSINTSYTLNSVHVKAVSWRKLYKPSVAPPLIYTSYKVKSHMGIIGNECAIANYQAIQDKSNAETEVPNAETDGNPLYNSFGLPLRKSTHQHNPQTHLPLG